MDLRSFLVGILALVLLNLARAADTASPSPRPAFSTTPAHLATDEEMRRAIIHGILANPDVMAADLRVQVENGAVTLDGTVRDAAAKKMAEEVAERVPGVGNVINRLQLRRPE